MGYDDYLWTSIVLFDCFAILGFYSVWLVLLVCLFKYDLFNTCSDVSLSLVCFIVLWFFSLCCCLSSCLSLVLSRVCFYYLFCVLCVVGDLCSCVLSEMGGLLIILFCISWNICVVIG